MAKCDICGAKIPDKDLWNCGIDGKICTECFTKKYSCELFPGGTG